jgi:hypothetical protein
MSRFAFAACFAGATCVSGMDAGLLWSRNCWPDGIVEFGESFCLCGGLGQFQAMYLMSLAMAHAGRSGK